METKSEAKKYAEKKMMDIARAAREHHIPIRIVASFLFIPEGDNGEDNIENAFLLNPSWDDIHEKLGFKDTLNLNMGNGACVIFCENSSGKVNQTVTDLLDKSSVYGSMGLEVRGDAVMTGLDTIPYLFKDDEEKREWMADNILDSLAEEILSKL